MPFGVTITPLDPLDGDEDGLKVQSLTGISKCAHCGAPHACSNTHALIGRGEAGSTPLVLCYLCGRTAEARTFEAASPDTTQLFALPLRLGASTPQYEVPAEQCPPLWIISLDGACTDRRYWTLVSQTLQSTLSTAPPHVLVALLTATTTRNRPTWGVFDLSSPIPSVRHGAHVPISFAPARSPHVSTAIRSLVDYVPLASSTTTNGITTPPPCCPLDWVMESILESITASSRLAGDRTAPAEQRAYAGARVLAWLTQRPAVAQRRKSPTTSTEMTPAALHERYPDVLTKGTTSVEYYAALGRSCADAGIGVDIVLSSLDVDDPVDFGLALFGCLSERSGAPAPCILSDEAEEVLAQVSTRTPWHENGSVVFGAELRLRLPPGYAVDADSVAPADSGTVGPQLATTESGLLGAASRTTSSQLWRMGICHPFAAVSLDLLMAERSTTDVLFVPECGEEVALHPVLQTCFAYTTVIQKDDGRYYTVRQMRIASRSFLFARTVEGLYASLDPEALAVVLFSKLSLASAQDGRVEAALMAQQWVLVLLTNVYRSAEDELERQRIRKEKGVEPPPETLWESQYFVPSERLLDFDGEISTANVLLGSGHERLRRVVLMVYLLLQSDPLRLGSEWSLDERWAMTSLMMSVTPSVLTRTIAPRLQLWESGGTSPILDVLDLKSEAVQSAILEHSRNSRRPSSGLILLLDTPREVVAMDARFVNSESKVKNLPALKPGPNIVEAMEETADSYRTRPRIVYDLDQASTSGESTFTRLMDCLVEDTANVALGCENFTAFEAQIVGLLEK